VEYLAEFICGRDGCSVRIQATDPDSDEAKFQARLAWQHHLQAEHGLSFEDAQIEAAKRRVVTIRVEVL